MSDTTPAICPTCGSTGRFAFAEPHWGVYRCTNGACGLAFAHPQPSDAWLDTQYANDYAHAEEATGHGSTPEPYVHVLLDAVEARTGPLRGRHVLDFGAGIGTIAGVLLARGAAVEAVEQSEAGRAQIRSVGGLPVANTVAGLRDVGGGPPYDVIVMVEVIEHLRDPKATLIELRSMLSADGVMFLTTPNLGSLRSRLEGARWVNVASPTHLLYFDAHSLRATLRAAGFDRIETIPEAARHPEQPARRRLLQRVLQPLGLDGGLQVLARPAA